MQSNEESRPASKLKVFPPNQIKSPTESTTPVAQLPTNVTNPSNDGRKSYHTWIMVGTILVAMTGIGFIPWNHTVSRPSTIEPNPEQSKISPLSLGHTLKELNPTTEVKAGDTIAITTDPQNEEKLIKTAQNIISTEDNRKLIQGELNIANSQLQKAEANLRTAITISEQSRRNVLGSPSIIVIEKEIEARQIEQNSLTAQLRNKETSLAAWTKRINDGLIGYEYPQVVEVRNQIDDLNTRISPLNAQIEQAKARREALIIELGDRAEKDLVNLAEPNAAVVIAEREVQQVIQKGVNIDRQLQEYKQEKKFLEQVKAQETIHKAEFNGVADFTEAQKYLGKKLTKPIDIVVYNPQNMLAKIMVSDAERQVIQEKQPITFTLENGKEIKGKVQLLSLQSEGQIDPNNPTKRLHEVWIAFDDFQEFKKGMTGHTVVMIQEERIYNIVGREVSNVMPFLKPFFYWLAHLGSNNNSPK